MAGVVGERVRELIRELCAAEDVTILKGHVARDHVHLFVGLARNPDHDDLARPVEAREVGGIAFVVLALHARALRDELRGDHVARVPPRAERAMQHIPGATRLVTRVDLPIAGHARDSLLELGEVVRQFVEARRHLRRRREDRDRDRVLVHIHPEIDHRARRRNRSSRNRRCRRCT